MSQRLVWSGLGQTDSGSSSREPCPAPDRPGPPSVVEPAACPYDFHCGQANLNVKNRYEQTALALAKTEGTPEMVKLLVDAGRADTRRVRPILHEAAPRFRQDRILANDSQDPMVHSCRGDVD